MAVGSHDGVVLLTAPPCLQVQGLPNFAPRVGLKVPVVRFSTTFGRWPDGARRPMMVTALYVRLRAVSSADAVPSIRHYESESDSRSVYGNRSRLSG